MPKAVYETPWDVIRYRQKLADLVRLLERAARLGCQLDPQAVIDAGYPISDVTKVREFAKKHGLLHAVEDSVALIAKNYPGLDKALRPIADAAPDRRMVPKGRRCAMDRVAGGGDAG